MQHSQSWVPVVSRWGWSMVRGGSSGWRASWSLLFRNVEGSRHFSASITSGALDPTDPAAVDRNIAARNKVVEVAVCGTDLPDAKSSVPAE